MNYDYPPLPSPYRNGIGFKISDTSFAIQAGDTSSPSLLSNLNLIDLLSHNWTSPSLQGVQPSPRARMSVSINTTTNIAYFYGGRTELTQSPMNYFNSFYNFDIKTLTWNWPKVFYFGGIRPARYGHSSNLISNRLFIMGGKTTIFSSELNAWTFSPSDFQSILVYDTTQHQAVTMATIGDVPPARYSFSTVNAPDGESIVLFGGQNATSLQDIFDASNDVYILNTCTLNWSQPIIKGNPPIARAGHEAIVYKNRYMIVMMGIQNFVSGIGPVYIDDIAILDMKTWTWISSISEDKDFVSVPNCRFTFPIVLSDNNTTSINNDGSSNNNMTTVSNPHLNSSTKQLALGITFGILGFLLLTTAFVIFIMKVRKDIDPKQNPRWIPSVLKKNMDSRQHA
ncbi:uncharacterized protein BX663DRAFT_583041 [Cokeromyces recurvatus]|uniref:uncharacterized protein n=1 Tax=Cokeromyces recurvatus TaxID=90255 RepID=UPI002220DD4B|nr:uncharacterized protein BX663DRAFT_583041 [Cokeromyces recurvatus]KAI7897962.1 hypothetical protein BX663DRAFT_583041 [Cokeromyces recurvatus]